MTVLNKAQGNMFPFVTHTWNPLGGHCSHECPYCYMKGFQRFKAHAEKYGGKARVIKEAMGDLGKNHTIFVANCTDLMAADVENFSIMDVLKHCRNHANAYLFLTKNPSRYLDLKEHFPVYSLIGTTIESDILSVGHAPGVMERLHSIRAMEQLHRQKTMISIEPVIRFSPAFARLIIDAKPEFVAIGANTDRYKLPEPSKGEVIDLITQIEGAGIKVIQKPNLARITGVSP